MPTTYAHYRFGCTVYNHLPNWEKYLIDTYRPLYDMGLHGPDVLFYYRPFLNNPVRTLGNTMHNQTGQAVFTQAGERILQEVDFRPMLAFTYGFLCHFVLDSMCHGYVAQKIAQSGISHSEIEAEFDRALMVHDGYNPVRHCVTGHLKPTREMASILSRFFLDVTQEQTYEAMRSMVRYLDLLTAPSHLKRGALYAVLTASGNRGMCDLIVNKQANPACFDSTEELVHRYVRAQPIAVQAICSYFDIIHGNETYDDLFDRTFDPSPQEDMYG